MTFSKRTPKYWLPKPAIGQKPNSASLMYEPRSTLRSPFTKQPETLECWISVADTTFASPRRTMPSEV